MKCSRPRAFTLLELLVVVGMIALLVGAVFPALRAARRAAVRSACLSNEHQIGAAIFAYAADYDGVIPYGPKAPPATSTNFYPGTGNVTSLLSLQSGAPVALGLLLNKYLSKTPHVLFCPGADQPEDADLELSKVGHGQAQGDYYYRHGSSVSLSDNILTMPPTTAHIRLRDLGSNRNDQPIRALVMDQNFWSDPNDPNSANWAATWGLVTRTNHDHRTVNVLFSDGHVATLDNTATPANPHGPLTIDPVAQKVLPEDSLDLILKAFESADLQ